MRQWARYCGKPALLIAVVAMAAAAWSAPMMPLAPKLTDDLRSLTGLKTIRLDLTEIADLVAGSPFTIPELKKTMAGPM